MNIIDNFLNEKVIVETNLSEIEGKLVRYEVSQKDGHVPFVLVLKNRDGALLVVRDWIAIKGFLNVRGYR